MKVLIVYGSTEGYTRKIATFIAGHLAQARHAVTLVDATEAPSSVAVNEYDAILIAASVHLGRYQSSIVHFAQSHREALNARKAGFISVSLAAVSDDRDDREGLRNCVAEFARETRWLPSEVLHAAGALRFTQYAIRLLQALGFEVHRLSQGSADGYQHRPRIHGLASAHDIRG